jgi:hypothetical protein
MIRSINRRNEMTLPTNHDFANRELSIEELEAIAAGGWFSSALHWVGHEASSIGHDIVAADKWVGSEVRKIGANPVVASMAATLVIAGGIATVAA